MKKLLLITASAMMVFASCTKEEVRFENEDQPQEIALFSVNKSMTKGAVAGTEYPTNYGMDVVAYLADGGESAANFFPETAFTSKAQGTTPETYLWTGSRFWPLTYSKINFLAVSQVPTGYTGATVNTEFDATNYASEATVDFVNKTTSFNQFDLMYAAGLGDHSNATPYPNVVMKFEHALSWINFKVAKNNVSAKITVNSIELNGAHYGGELTLTNSKYNATTAYETSAAVTPAWSNLKAAEDDIFVPNAAGTAKANKVVLSTSLAALGNGLMVIPNKYTADYPSFTINYTIDQDGNDATTGDVTTYEYTHNFATSGNFEWEIKTKYTYNITISLHEIKIDPQVEAWDEAAGVTIPLG